MNRFQANTPLQPVISIQGRAILHLDHGGPAFHGGGNTSYSCPHCGHVLAESVAESRIFDLVVECGICHKLSEFDRLPAGATASGYLFVPAGTYRITDTVELPGPTLIIGEGAITGGGNPLWN